MTDLQPITRREMLLNSIAEGTVSGITPITRQEQYLQAIAKESTLPENMSPITREEMLYESILTGNVPVIQPITRSEIYLFAIANKSELPSGMKPITREEMFYQKILNNGGAEPPTPTFEWTLEWDYTNGAMPNSNEWSMTEASGGTHSTTFVSGKGIKWTGNGWGLTFTPKDYKTTTNGIMEAVFNYERIAENGSVRTTLSTESDCISGFLTADGVRINGSTGTLIPNTTPTTNKDYTLRVERTASNGKVYLDGTLVYDGELRELAGTNNVLVSKNNLSGTMTVYVKAMRFYHKS